MTGVDAGLHLVTWLPDHLEESRTQMAAQRAGVHLVGLRPYRLHPDAHHRGGLVFGYSALSERSIVEGIELLAAALNPN